MRFQSNAFNFSSFLNGGVDTRTGQYNCRIKLATISPEGPSAASREIGLSFSMMEESDTGYGLGWTLSQSEYNENTRRLRLLSGETYTTQPLPSIGNLVTFRDKKLKHMEMRRISVDVLHVIYKDGAIEVLTRRRQGTGLFSLTQLIFENGERFDFSYTSEDFLSSVRNAQSGRQILSMTYNSRLLSQADILQEQGRSARIHCSTFNNQLSSISLPVAIPSPSTLPRFEFQYQNLNGYLVISNLRNPMGGEDLITHQTNGHSFISGQFIPYVITLNSRSNGPVSSDLVHRYMYSQNNFTGSPFIAPFDPDFDNIYVRTSEYNYSCIDQVIDSSGLVAQETTHNYNRFHLQTSEVTTRAGARHQISYTYNENGSNLSFSAQPANLQLPSRIVNRFDMTTGGTSREEIESMVTDDFGNTRSHTYASGIREEFDYYPIAGQTGRCPAEPHGLFQRFVSTKRVVPTVGTAKVTDHTYTYITGLGNGVNFVLLESTNYAGQLTERTVYSPASTTAALHGRPSYTETTLNNYTSRSDYSYALSGDLLTENRQISGYDGTRISSSTTSSVVNGMVVAMQKNNITSNWSFDVNGRIVQESVSSGTPSAASRQYTYQFASGSNRARQELTDVLGGRYITYFDGFGRITEKYQYKSNAEQLIEQNTYNRLGQLMSRTIVDRINGTEYRMTTSYSYDGWGQAVRITRPDRSVIINEFNPITRALRVGVENAGSVRAYFNEFDKVSLSERVATNNQTQRLSSRTYDGFGRCSSETNANGVTDSYTYDVFDRIIRKSTSGAGTSRTCEFSYPTHLVEPYQTIIRVDGTDLGNARYDGLGRMISLRRGNASAPAFTYSYTNNSIDPQSITTPAGVTQTLQYHAQLDTLSLISATGGSGNLSNSFTWDARTGTSVRSVSADSQRDITVDEYGRIRSDTQTIQGQAYTNMFSYSPAGRITSMQSALGDTESMNYDQSGRFMLSQSTASGAHQTSVSYDAQGRTQSWTSYASGQTVKTELYFDVFGRESSRRITKNGSEIQNIALTYRSDDKIASRTITNSGSSSSAYSTELFGYDGYDRLTSYSCTGTQYPADQYGRSIRAQTFVYNAWNNLTRVDTTFSDGSTDSSIRSYTSSDPCRPTQITHSNPQQTLTLSYDLTGNLISDGINTYTYNAFGKLISARRSGVTTAAYGYDAMGRQIRLNDGDGNTMTCHYAGSKLIGLRQSSAIGRHFNLRKNVLARSMNSISGEVFSADSASSVLSVSTASNIRHVQYTPYGSSQIDTGSGSLIERSRPGFNGERIDPMTRLYHLGNGQRAYSPDLIMFLSPDPRSPFDIGGINSYGYCGGDPINFRDPTGLSARPHWTSWLLWGIGVAATLALFAPMGLGLLAGKGLVLMGVKKTFTASTLLLSTAASGASLSIAEIDAARGTDNSKTSNILMGVGVFFGVLSFSGMMAGGLVSNVARPRAALRRNSFEMTPLRSANSNAANVPSASGGAVYGHNTLTTPIARPSSAVIHATRMINATPYAYGATLIGLTYNRMLGGDATDPEFEDPNTNVPKLPWEDPNNNVPKLPPEDANTDIPILPWDPPPDTDDNECDDPFACWPFSAKVGAIRGIIDNQLRFESTFRQQALRLRSSAIFDL